VSRGNQLAISGPTEAVEAARIVINALYARLKRGLDVDRHEVDAMLRLAQAGAGAIEPAIGGRFGFERGAVRTQRRTITARSAGQAAYLKALHEHDLVFGVGPAGTGKTYLAVAVGVAM